MAFLPYKWFLPVSHKGFLSKRLLTGLVLLATTVPAQSESGGTIGRVVLSERPASTSASPTRYSAGEPTRKRTRQPARHPFYVSVTEINHNAKDKILEISCKLFTSDLEAVLEKNLHTKVDLSSVSDKKTADGYISAYVIKNLQVQVDGKTVSLQFVGSEKEQDATWSYFQVSNITTVKKLDIVNSLLYDGFDKEINIMHVSVGGERKSGKVEYPQAGISFDW